MIYSITNLWYTQNNQYLNLIFSYPIFFTSKPVGFPVDWERVLHA